MGVAPPVKDALRFHVLVVEDNPADAKLLEILLGGDRFSQYRIFHAPNLKKAMELMLDDIPDVVLLDLSLPDSFGTDTIHRVRSAHADLPVIVLTAHGSIPDAVAATSPSDIREGIFFGEYIEGEKGVLNRFTSEYPMYAEDGDTSFIRVLQGFVSRAQRSGLSDLVSDLCGRIMKERAGLISEPVPDPLTGLLPGEKPSIAELKKPEVEIREVPLREATPALDIPQAGEAVTAERPDEQERFKEILAASVEQVFRNVALPEGRMELIRNLIRDTEITADLTTRGPPSLTLHTGRYILRLSHEQFNDLSQGKISDTGIFILLAQLAHELVFKDYYSHYSIEREELNSFIHKFTAIYDKAVSLTGIDKEKVDELLNKFLLFNRKDDLVKTYSSGMKQRLKFIFALMHSPQLIILDEPTSAIDAKAEAEIFDRLNRETKENTVIFISHRFSTIKDAHRIVVIDHGKIIEDGDHEKLIKNKGKYAALYSLQAERYTRE